MRVGAVAALGVCVLMTLTPAEQSGLRQSASAFRDVSGVADSLNKSIDASCGDGQNVRVLGVAAKEAKDAEARWAKMMLFANESFGSSGMPGVSLSNAGFRRLSESSGTDIEQDTRDLAGTGDARFDQVHALRDQLAADVVVLLGRYNGAQGWAARIGAGPETAFATVNVAYDELHLLAHEVGHLLGAAHFDEPSVPLPGGRGFVSSSNQWRTVMGGRETAEIVPRWSDKNRPHPGTVEREGSAEAHLVPVLPERFKVVSTFRCSSPNRH